MAEKLLSWRSLSAVFPLCGRIYLMLLMSPDTVNLHMWKEMAAGLRAAHGGIV